MRDAMSEPKKPGQAWSDARRAVLYGGTCQEKCWLQFSACRVAPVCVAIELNLNPHPLHTTETQRMGHPALAQSVGDKLFYGNLRSANDSCVARSATIYQGFLQKSHRCLL